MDEKVITLGGGCFWCVEAVYEELKGVERVESGYSGGKVTNPFLPASVYRNHRPCRGCTSYFRPEGDFA